MSAAAISTAIHSASPVKGSWVPATRPTAPRTPPPECFAGEPIVACAPRTPPADGVDAADAGADAAAAGAGAAAEAAGVAGAALGVTADATNRAELGVLCGVLLLCGVAATCAAGADFGAHALES